MNRRDAVRRIFAIGAGLTAGGLLVRQSPTLDDIRFVPDGNYFELWIDGRLVRMERHRRMPPGHEFYIDPKAMRRLQLSGMDEDILRTCSEEDAAAHVCRVMARDTEFHIGRQWDIVRHGNLTASDVERVYNVSNLLR